MVYSTHFVPDRSHFLSNAFFMNALRGEKKRDTESSIVLSEESLSPILRLDEKLPSVKNRKHILDRSRENCWTSDENSL